MSKRKRFLSGWNGVAMIIFVAGWFIKFRPLGFSSFGFAIFMWIVGGSLARIIFGPKDRSNRRKTGEVLIQTPTSITLVCPSCGAGIDDETNFCPECGTSIEVQNKHNLHQFNK